MPHTSRLQEAVADGIQAGPQDNWDQLTHMLPQELVEGVKSMPTYIGPDDRVQRSG